MSLRIVPGNTSTSEDKHVVSTKSTAHPVTGLHDTFRYGLKSAAQDVSEGTLSPLQARLEKWSTTQTQLQQTVQRNTFGLSVPLRQAMEIQMVQETSANPLLSVPTVGALPLGGSHNVSLEILQGNDESLDVGDFMGGERPVSEILDVNSVMEKSRRI